MPSNTETVQAMYQAFGRGDVPAILACLREDVEWEHDAVDHGVPWLKPRRGPAEVGRFFADLAGVEISRFEPMSFLASADQVAAVIAIELAVKATGRTVRDLELHLWTFDSSGRVSRFRHVVDTHQHVLAYRGA
jgi:ketosteroid isomerase-like protein